MTAAMKLIQILTRHIRVFVICLQMSIISGKLITAAKIQIHILVQTVTFNNLTLDCVYKL